MEGAKWREQGESGGSVRGEGKEVEGTEAGNGGNREGKMEGA